MSKRFKLNFASASRGNSSEGGSGEIIKNKEVQNVFIYLKLNGKVTYNQEEMIALVEGIKFFQPNNLCSI